MELQAPETTQGSKIKEKLISISTASDEIHWTDTHELYYQLWFPHI